MNYTDYGGSAPLPKLSLADAGGGAPLVTLSLLLRFFLYCGFPQPNKISWVLLWILWHYYSVLSKKNGIFRHFSAVSIHDFEVRNPVRHDSEGAAVVCGVLVKQQEFMKICYYQK